MFLLTGLLQHEHTLYRAKSSFLIAIVGKSILGSIEIKFAEMYCRAQGICRQEHCAVLEHCESMI